MYSFSQDKDGSVHSYLEIVNADTIMENSFCMSSMIHCLMLCTLIYQVVRIKT